LVPGLARRSDHLHRLLTAAEPTCPNLAAGLALARPGEDPRRHRRPDPRIPRRPRAQNRLARYATLRNTIEGLNGYAKDPAHEALAQPARRRVRGIAAQSIFTALLLITANIRKIRAWRELTADGTTGSTARRASLRDHLPDG
jgi:ferric-dicitrate binding protein FerR (iron transport regulator)